MLKDEALTKQYLTAYYTNKIRDQYNAVKESVDSSYDSTTGGSGT